MDPETILLIIESLKEAIELVTNPLRDLTSAINGVVAQLAPFVQALSPSTMEAFRQAMLDVQATIGVAFTGAVQVITQMTRELGGVLLPIMQKLAPIVTEVANVFSTLLLGAVRLLVSPLEVLAPLLEVVVHFAREFATYTDEVMAVLTAAVKVFRDLAAALFGTDTGGIKDVFKQLFDVVRQVTKALATLWATLAVAVGAGDTVKRFGEAIAKEAEEREKAAAGAKAAANNPQITNIAQIAREAQLRAFTAAGGAGVKEKTNTEWLRELSDDLKKIAGDKRSLKDTLTDWWDKEVMGGNKGIFGKVVRFISDISEKIRVAVNRIADGIGRFPFG